MNILAREISFDQTRIVADIGSGTGILSKLFLENGNRVFAVEPNEEMRRIAEKTLAKYPGFVSIDAKAEDTTISDASADLATVGQALHWFDTTLAPREFARILNSNGHLCVLYNDRNKESAFMKAYDQVVQKYARDRAKVPDINQDLLSKFYRGAKYSKFELPNEQFLDYNGLLSRMTSASYMPRPEETKVFSSLTNDIEGLFNGYESSGKVRLAYRTAVFLGQIGR